MNLPATLAGCVTGLRSVRLHADTAGARAPEAEVAGTVTTARIAHDQTSRIGSERILGQLARAVHRGLDRVQERGTNAGLLQLADGVDRRAARRGDRLPKLDRVHLLVAEQL